MIVWSWISVVVNDTFSSRSSGRSNGSPNSVLTYHRVSSHRANRSPQTTISSAVSSSAAAAAGTRAKRTHTRARIAVSYAEVARRAAAYRARHTLTAPVEHTDACRGGSTVRVVIGTSVLAMALLAACANSGLGQTDADTDTDAPPEGTCPWVGTWTLTTITCGSIEAT